MKSFITNFVLFFLIIWLIEAIAMGSPKQDLYELWECFTSYQLRHHLLDSPYIIALSFFLALPSLKKKDWMSWNFLTVFFFYSLLFYLCAASDMIGFYFPPSLIPHYGLDSLGEKLWEYESVFIVYPCLLLLTLMKVKAWRLLAIILVANFIGWHSVSFLFTWLFSVLSSHASWAYYLHTNADVVALCLMIFFLTNACVLSVTLPRTYKRRLSKEEKEWEEHVQEYRRSKTSFVPTVIPDLPAPTTPHSPPAVR